MYSVTQRIRMVKQPYGGYINRKELTVTQLDDGITLNASENVHASLIGLAVDYMTRFVMGTERKEAFAISLNGAITLDHVTADENQTAVKNALKLLSGINGLDKQSVVNACKLVGYDVCYRAGIRGYKPVEEINPDDATVENIMTMVSRAVKFWEQYGPIVKDGFDFEGGYTYDIAAGDGDYLTEDTLWDFKVSKKEPEPKYTLQILVYYLMGIHSVHPEFQSIKRLGIYNPRLNKVYTIDVDKISKSVIDTVSSEVIGYE